MASNRRVEFDRNVQTLGSPSLLLNHGSSSTSDQTSWASTSASGGSMASTSTAEHYQRQSATEVTRYSSPAAVGPYQSYQNGHQIGANRIEYYEEDDDDDLIDSNSIYMNQGGYHHQNNNVYSKIGHHEDNHFQHHHPHLHPHPTTLYRNGSVSIVNCEYKLKEKYPHLIYLLFFVVIYILLILLGASLFVLFEAKTEIRLRDQILLQQQMFLEGNTCVDVKDLKQFVKSIMIANDKGVNLAKLNELVEMQEAKERNESLAVLNKNSTSTSAIPEFAQVALETVEKTFYKQKQPESGNKYLNKAEMKEKEQSEDELAGELKSDKKHLPASSDASIQIPKQSIPIKVPVEMANWEFFSSLNYVTTVVTTIGYGHVTPVTEEGKILTLVFGAIAIPATLLFFSVIISAIRDGPVKSVEIWLIKLFSHFTQITLLKIRFFHLVLITFMLFLMLILLPSFIFLQLEPEWTFLDSFYYCFITITTVGLGDFVPAQSVALIESRPFYLLGTVLYMYFGLCMIMLWIALVLRIPHFNFKTFLVIEEPEISEEKIPDERTALLENSINNYASIY